MVKGKTTAGFTVVELLVTIALASMLLTLGVPSFQETIQRNRITAQTNEFISSLILARSEAVTRGEPVIICKSVDRQTCSTDAAVNYASGWLLYTDTNADSAPDSDEIIRAYGAAAESITIKTAGAAADQMVYLSTGFLDLTASADFFVCDANHDKQKQVTLRPIGRASVRTIKDSSSC